MKCILLIVIYIVYLNSALASNGCPEDWSYYGESCYAYVNFKETWTGAAEICERFGGFLVEIDSSSENDFVKQLLRNSGAGSVWTGGNDLLRSRRWSWLFSGNRIKFTDWAPGEPHATSTERCIQLWRDRSFSMGRWDLCCTTCLCV
ncbi:lithostathine-1-like [Haliotis rubra]|uniref:lithostathine-1-like n=1 Tax=Haliotis rubra TaxID=36100 RepID=UPI001EE62996|nr:lithostathine-1-like [Haliotis rubra]